MSDSSARPDTQFLNLFRAIAAFWVVLGHCIAWGGVQAFPAPGMAVDLFMVISGFLMVYTVDRARRGDGWVRDFYVRRFFRIAPAYYIALAAVFVLQHQYRAGMEYFQGLNPGGWSADYLASAFPPIDFVNLIMHVTFLFGLVPQYADSTMLPDWSLGLEMQFYAVFPALYFCARHRRFLVVAICLIIICVAGRMGYYRLADAGAIERFREPSLLLFSLPMFLVGMVIHEAREKGVAWAVTAVGLLLALELRAHGASGLTVSVLVALLAGCWLYRLELLQRWCRSKLISFASDCSYSVYLTHGFALFLAGPLIFRPELGKAMALACLTATVIVLSYGASWLSFLYVEKPGIALGKRFAKKSFNAPPMT